MISVSNWSTSTWKRILPALAETDGQPYSMATKHLLWVWQSIPPMIWSLRRAVMDRSSCGMLRRSVFWSRCRSWRRSRTFPVSAISVDWNGTRPSDKYCWSFLLIYFGWLTPFINRFWPFHWTLRSELSIATAGRLVECINGRLWLPLALTRLLSAAMGDIWRPVPAMAGLSCGIPPRRRFCPGERLIDLSNQLVSRMTYNKMGYLHRHCHIAQRLIRVTTLGIGP